jgi:protein TonB
LLLPILAPESIPRLHFIDPIMAPQPEAAGPKASARPAGGSTAKAARPEAPVLLQPAHVPETIFEGPGEVADAPLSNVPSGLCIGTCPGAGGSKNGVPGGTGLEPAPVVRPPDPPTTRVRVSIMDPGFLVHRVQPVYPDLPRRIRIQGPVVLRAVISRSGEIQELRVISGHPMLSPAALDAVRQWRYRPYLLNGVAVEVETQVTVNFVLSDR